MPPALERLVFSLARAAEYFSTDELQAMTGQPYEHFATALLKELLDNAADACEAKVALERYAVTGETPGLLVGWHVDGDTDLTTIEVVDNGAGIPPTTVQRILDFHTRTSDKLAYRSPTRGAMGNAWKTVFGMVQVLGGRAPVVIEAQGIRHTLVVTADPAGVVHVTHDQAEVPLQPGTRVTLQVPTGDQECDPTHWGRAFAVFNPHLAVRICQAPHHGSHAHPGAREGPTAGIGTAPRSTFRGAGANTCRGI